jgi:hypothetical protein
MLLRIMKYRRPLGHFFDSGAKKTPGLRELYIKGELRKLPRSHEQEALDPNIR